MTACGSALSVARAHAAEAAAGAGHFAALALFCYPLLFQRKLQAPGGAL